MTSTDWAAAAAFGSCPLLGALMLSFPLDGSAVSPWALVLGGIATSWIAIMSCAALFISVDETAEEIKEERARERELRIHEMRRIIREELKLKEEKK